MSRNVHSLLLKSAYIQSRIERERVRSMPDWIMLLRLKLLHLRVKDRLRSLSAAALHPSLPETAVARAGA